MVDSRTLERALAHVNAARAVLGFPRLSAMPKGRKGCALGCPLARALPEGTAVGPETCVIRDVTRRDADAISEVWGSGQAPRIIGKECRLVMSSEMRIFRTGFDAGLYPALIEGV